MLHLSLHIFEKSGNGLAGQVDYRIGNHAFILLSIPRF